MNIHVNGFKIYLKKKNKKKEKIYATSIRERDKLIYFLNMISLLILLILFIIFMILVINY